MTAETIKKRDELIHYFGSIDNYQKNIFHLVPPLFLMICDEKGEVVIDKESLGKYINKEMNENNITFEALVQRDIQTFSNVIDNYYLQIFNK